MRSRCYGTSTYAKCYEVRPADRYIVDAGANIGLFATWAARRAPQARLLCVEPHPATYSRLLKTVQDLGVADRVKAVQSALGGDSEPRWLEDSAGGDSTESYVTNRQPPQGQRVACTTLAGLLEQAGWDAVDLLKVASTKRFCRRRRNRCGGSAGLMLNSTCRTSGLPGKKRSCWSA